MVIYFGFWSRNRSKSLFFSVLWLKLYDMTIYVVFRYIAMIFFTNLQFVKIECHIHG